MTIKDITTLFKRYTTAKDFCKKAEKKYGKELKDKPADFKEQFDYDLVCEQYSLFKKSIKATDSIFFYMGNNFDPQIVLCIKRHYMNDESTANLAKELNISKRKLDYDIQHCLKKVQEHFDGKW